MLADLLALNVFAFVLVFARVGSAMMLLPGFAARYVPVRVRLVTALAIAFVVTPTLAPILPAPPDAAWQLIGLFVKEILTGVFLGTLAAVFVASLQTAGTLIALFAGLANALIQDAIAQQQSSVVASLLSAAGVLLVFITDMHHLMLTAVVDSYMLFAPSEPFLWGDAADILAREVANSFALGLQMAAPFLLVAIVYYTGLGLLGRLMPALPVFFIGLPVQISVQMWVLSITLSGIMMVFLQRFQDGYAAFLNP